jgi:hypothetical protein
VHIDNDVENCGGCAMSCPDIANGTRECRGGRCRARCNSGFKDCGGACVDTRSDPAHCNGCGKVCTGLCVLGECLLEL